MYFHAIVYTFFIISTLFSCRNYTILLSSSRTKRFANLTSNFAPCPMAFCNAVGKVSNWNAGGVTLADLLLLLWWTMHFVLWEQDSMSHLCWQVSKICTVFGYAFQHIPFKWMHHTFHDIVWHLNIHSALFTLQSYILFFLQKALISIWMLSLPTHHWLCIITSRTSLQHISTAPANTWYHYLLVLLPSKSCCHHGKKARGAMAVTSGLLGLNNTWCTTIIVSQWWWNTPTSRDSLSNAATATMAWTP
jgi:hypothetical protein